MSGLLSYLPKHQQCTADARRRPEVCTAQHEAPNTQHALDYDRIFVRLLKSPLDLSWEDAVDMLVEMECEGKSTQPLSVSQLLECAELIRASNAHPASLDLVWFT